jgi:S-ribosylhomocysteine lyase LuxS involved in autoinducer biosynthesis
VSNIDTTGIHSLEDLLTNLTNKNIQVQIIHMISISSLVLHVLHVVIILQTQVQSTYIIYIEGRSLQQEYYI